MAWFCFVVAGFRVVFFLQISVGHLKLGKKYCPEESTQFGSEVFRVIRLSPYQPDHAFESSTTTKVITMLILWPSSSLWKVREPVTKELRNHFAGEYRILMTASGWHTDWHGSVVPEMTNNIILIKKKYLKSADSNCSLFLSFAFSWIVKCSYHTVNNTWSSLNKRVWPWFWFQLTIAREQRNRIGVQYRYQVHSIVVNISTIVYQSGLIMELETYLRCNSACIANVQTKKITLLSESLKKCGYILIATNDNFSGIESSIHAVIKW